MLGSESGMLDPASIEHRTHSESVRWLASGVMAFLQPTLCLSPVSTGRSGCVRWLTVGDPVGLQNSLCMSRCAPDASGVDLQSIWCFVGNC